MQKKVEESKKWSRSEKLQVLSLIIAFLYPLLQYLPFLTKIITGLSLRLEIPLLTTRLLIVLTLFVILTLYLSLRCIFKFHKKNSSRIPASAYKTSMPNVKLPPKKYMDKILLRIGQEDYLTQYQICSCFPDDDKTKIHHYIDLLCKSKHLLLESAYTNTYELSSKGREYLVENNLLSKQFSNK